MIKINKKPNPDFIERYEEVIYKKLITDFERYNIDHSDSLPLNFSSYFSNKKLENIIFADASELEAIINDVYEKFPQLAERYFPTILINNISIKRDILDNNLKKENKDNRNRFDKKFNEVILDLKSCTSNFNSVLLKRIIEQMEVSKSYTEKKKILRKINSYICEEYRLTKKDIDLFPDWINKFFSLFNYQTMHSRFSLEINNELGVYVCPYCNLEDTESIDGETKIVPDLDHFHPQSKFPFLSLTLSNLVPSGSICNQRFKKNNSMLGYVNPYLLGVGKEIIFKITNLEHMGVGKEEFLLRIDPPQMFKNNFKIFNIPTMYDRKKLQSWYKLQWERFDFVNNAKQLEDTFLDVNSPEIRSIVDLTTCPTKIEAQKFKYDLIVQTLDDFNIKHNLSSNIKD